MTPQEIHRSSQLLNGLTALERLMAIKSERNPKVVNLMINLSDDDCSIDDDVDIPPDVFDEIISVMCEKFKSELNALCVSR